MTTLLERPGARAATAGAGSGVRGIVGAIVALAVVAAWSGAAGAWERLATPGGPATVAGAAAAMVAASLILALVVLVARVPLLESHHGQVALVGLHRRVAPWAVVAVVAHVALTSTGGALARGGDPLGQVVVYATTYPWMLPALASAVMIVSLSFGSWRRVLDRLHVRYETWWVSHLYLYLAIALALGHQLVTGSLFEDVPALRWAWGGLHAAVLVLVLVCRIGLPLARSLHHGLRVARVVPRTGWLEVEVAGRDLSRLRGGQFAQWRVLRPGLWWQAHPYSVVPAHDGRSLRLVVSGDGDMARELVRLRPGTRLWFEGPYGTITAARHARTPLLVVAGGAGASAALGLLVDLVPGGDVVVLVRARSASSPLLAEIREEGRRLGAVVEVVLGDRSEHPLDAEELAALVPGIARRTALVWGSASFVAHVVPELERAGVPHIEHEAFALGAPS